MTELLHVCARHFARDPSAIVVGRRDLSIQRQRGLERNQWAAGAHEVYERLVELFRLLGELGGDFHRDAGLAQHAKPAAGDHRIGILHRRDDFRHACRRDRFGAGSGAALVGARFQIDV